MVGEDDRDEAVERVRRRRIAAAARLLVRALELRVWIAEADFGRWKRNGRVELKAEGLNGDDGSAGGIVGRGDGDVDGDGDDCMISNT